MGRAHRTSAPDTLPGNGRIVASFGRRVLVEDDHANRHPAFLARRRLRVVCGDRVTWRGTDGDDAEIVECHERRNVLTRPDSRGRTEVLAANLGRLAVVCAPRPDPDLFMIDRYLAAAEHMDVAGLVVLNKTDMAGSGALREQLEAYERIGYPVIAVSAKSGDGLADLDQALAGETGILVGQSGVGKSSLINALCPGADVATAELSLAAGEGRHTTTASMLHHLPGGGALIDSPGVRDYAPGLVPRESVQVGFREIRDAAGHCRFANCLHLVEPGCAVRAGAEDGDIDPRRYESYRRLLRLVENLGKPSWS